MISPELEKKILSCLPYSKPFLFVDSIIDVNEAEIKGSFKFLSTEPYYKGHFRQKPVTPGVLLLETMGQIGLVCFGIYLNKIYETNIPFTPILSHLESDFLGIVLPGKTVYVHAQKEYYRNNILKCRITMTDSENRTVLTTIAICTFTFAHS
ncbi:MAG: hydroxymyristoyl-ACP dehydratase [Bacteroidota bacterium]